MPTTDHRETSLQRGARLLREDLALASRFRVVPEPGEGEEVRSAPAPADAR